VNRDPIAEQGGKNLYGFVGNDAILLVDRLGLIYQFQSCSNEGATEWVGSIWRSRVRRCYREVGALSVATWRIPDTGSISPDPNDGPSLIEFNGAVGYGRFSVKESKYEVHKQKEYECRCNSFFGNLRWMRTGRKRKMNYSALSWTEKDRNIYVPSFAIGIGVPETDLGADAEDILRLKLTIAGTLLREAYEGLVCPEFNVWELY
jgi:hypothetical protein